MRRSPALVPALLLLLVLHPGSAEERTANALADLIKRTYDFKPRALTEQERARKGTEITALWEAVRAAPAQTLPILRHALEDPAATPFFCFNGSNLLVSCDPTAAAKRFQISCYARADLHEVNLTYWVMTLATLAVEGFDTTPAACRWLEDPI